MKKESEKIQDNLESDYFSIRKGSVNDKMGLKPEDILSLCGFFSHKSRINEIKLIHGKTETEPEQTEELKGK